ncbi:phosphotransferase [Phycicoccus sp. M110.8]|uniref:phosphotransferase family protein n=1 Tax=Phycicoccus sp. M110.8 TaxID=3075433 RepID=UPI0028FDAF59|nr:phosphotransferase [Phycicoccus sp. M110.8]MDU0312214.1 phosphotransferase [Phycicoccus sp. M110.8]
MADGEALRGPCENGLTADVDYRFTSRRPEFADLPEVVQARIAGLAGAEVAHAHPAVTSGFTGAYAGLLELRDGRRVFAKAADPDHPFAHAALPREAAVLALLDGRAGAPNLVGAGEADVWTVNVLEAIDGRLPGMPWTPTDAAAAHAACVEWAALPTDLVARLTDNTVAEDVGRDQVALTCLDDLAAGARPWPEGCRPLSADQARELAELGRSAARALVGDRLVHGDLRPDNMLMTPGGRARFVDWNWVARGPGWCDFVGLLPLMAHQGLDADRLALESPLLAGVDPDAVDAFLAVIIGFMVEHAGHPDVDSSQSAVRAHQAQMARTFLAWLAHRRSW